MSIIKMYPITLERNLPNYSEEYKLQLIKVNSNIIFKNDEPDLWNKNCDKYYEDSNVNISEAASTQQLQTSI